MSSSLLRSPSLRRAAQRLGRRLYKWGRGEEAANDITLNGEGYVQAAVLRHVAGAVRVCDIGANQGDWTLELLKTARAAGREGDVTIDLFEPVPSTLERLQKNLAAYQSSARTRVNTFALSDTAGTASMAILSDTGGTNSLRFDKSTAESALSMIVVETKTLDEFCHSNGIGHLNLAKCDAEGHDLTVLRGAKGMLANGAIDVVQFEYNHRWIDGRAFLKDVCELIEGLPYKLGRVCPGYVELFAVWHPEMDRFFQSNYVIVHDRALAWFDARPGQFDESNSYVEVGQASS